MKKGRFSKEEERTIGRLINSMTPEDIAIQLNRDTESVVNFIKRKFNIGTSREEQAAYSLENRPYYKELRQQFTDEELELFKYHWSRMVSQFKNDVLPTEEVQIVDTIKLELLMNRCLKGNKENIDYIINLERQVASLRASQESLNKDYRELQAKKSTMLKEMKGTREQRIKRLEDSKLSFTAWVGTMMQDPDIMKKYGIEMEKMKLAMENEKARLSVYHKYEDGTIDQPFLTPDTVKD